MKYLLLVILAILSFSTFAIPVKEPAKADPIIIHTPQSFMDADNETWDKLADLFVSPLMNFKGQTVKFLVTGIGGEVLEVNKVVHALQIAESKGLNVEMEVVGTAISGHAFLLCGATKVTIESGSSVVFHSAGDFVSILGGFITARHIVTDPEDVLLNNYMLDQCQQKGLLSKQQVQDIENGKRVVFLSDKGKISSFTTEDYSNSWQEFIGQWAYLVFLGSGLLLFIGLIKRI